MKTGILFKTIVFGIPVFAMLSCTRGAAESEEKARLDIELDEFATILSSLPLGREQYDEVYDAVTCSARNGYDEEYMLRDLFSVPGRGVGDVGTKSDKSYRTPLKDLIADYLSSASGSRAGELSIAPEDYILYLAESDVQIYWPYSSGWNGHEDPIITFDPGDDSGTNLGYRIGWNDRGERTVDLVTVTEETAKRHPVWVVNRNSDSGFLTLEMIRREHPDWGMSGGSVVIGNPRYDRTKADVSDPVRALILKEFTAKRQYDCWFAGASEFFVKCGSVEDFSASTEAEMRLYNPAVTDFMVVVRRNQVGQKIPFNAVLVSQWTDQLESCAFMITEDDGGTMTEWKCSADVKIKSKTFGFNLALPFKSRDDIVWRGQLKAPYLEKYSGKTGSYGDVDIVFELVQL